MSKIGLIAKREFLSRVRKKSFIVTTILLPTLILGLYSLIIYFSVKAPSDTIVAIADNAHYFQDSLKSDPPIYFKTMQGADQKQLENLLAKNEIGAYVFIPSGTDSTAMLNIVSQKSLSLKTKQGINDAVNAVVKKQKMHDFHMTTEDIQKVNTPATIKYKSVEAGEDSMAKTGVSYAVGMVSGMVIYIVLLLYGMAVMRGVMEEKVSRIAEVIISSVKPFQLMMGKILGIGAVGLLQFLIWIVLTVGLRIILIPMLFPSVGDTINGSVSSQGSEGMQAVIALLSTINFPLLIICFLVYFLGGYLIYASLFAAVGSAVNEDPQEAQSFSFPVTMPIIFSVIIMMQAVNDPQSGLAVFGSLFPLTSPVVMMARVAQGVPDVVPYWQLGLSILFLILGFLLTTWFAGKVYRTGILMYGKKPTLKEIIKWARNK
ncbi:MAG: ABC transporter permease [Pseudopedobacter saltans]|uniref:ABC transporter permease n=1 Tax=Pseudopedobacter saltans TaxID=151895 RepID=A0A2W5F5G1_9SPHI|nr:MAG: ABC transporter permease [Pseudopedobacter saltans]